MIGSYRQAGSIGRGCPKTVASKALPAVRLRWGMATFPLAWKAGATLNRVAEEEIICVGTKEGGWERRMESHR